MSQFAPERGHRLRQRSPPPPDEGTPPGGMGSIPPGELGDGAVSAVSVKQRLADAASFSVVGHSSARTARNSLPVNLCDVTVAKISTSNINNDNDRSPSVKAKAKPKPSL